MTSRQSVIMKKFINTSLRSVLSTPSIGIDNRRAATALWENDMPDAESSSRWHPVLSLEDQPSPLDFLGG